MESVQMFKTSDGKVFETEAEARAHQIEVDAKESRAKFVGALVAAGYDKGQAASYARGASLFSVWLQGSEIPAPMRKKLAVPDPRQLNIEG